MRSISSFAILSSAFATMRPAEAMNFAVYSSCSQSPTFSKMAISSSMPLSKSSFDFDLANRLRACTRIGLTGCEALLIPLSFRKYSNLRLLSASNASMLTFIFTKSRLEAILKNAVTQTPRSSVAI